MTRKLLLTLIIFAGTFSMLSAQTSAEKNDKVVVKDEKRQGNNDQAAKKKAATNKEQYYLQPANRKKDLKAKSAEKKKPAIKNGNSEMNDEKDKL